MKRLILLFSLVALTVLATACGGGQPKEANLVNGEVWLDTDGNPINAHGGGMLYHDGTYYWYGEYKKGASARGRLDVIGISCYSSQNLKDWKYEGIVLPAVKDDPEHDLHPRNVLERPKVLYNESTGKFVMWAHVDSPNYSKASVGVAVCDSPAGQFEYQGSFRPCDSESRDQTLFVDDDGKAYHICSSENNKVVHISELTDDYLQPTGRYSRCFIDQSREAQAVFKHDGKYYMLSSACTGWDPNEAWLAVADSLMGEWTVLGNPCVGKDAEITFYGQSAYVQKVVGEEDKYIAMFDRWNKDDLENSRYLWLPIEFSDDGSITIPWRESLEF